MRRERLSDTVTLYCGDCLEVMAEMEAGSVDSVITDPPYGLQFMGKDWDKLWRNNTEADKEYVERTKDKGDGLTSRARKLLDYSASKPWQMQEWHYNWAFEALRVVKPGAMLLSFGGTRTYHRLVTAIEDAGWNVQDMIAWVYGSGFPKSHDVSKAIDREAGVEMERTFKSRNPADRPYTHTKGETSTGWKSPIRPDKTSPATPEAQIWDGWGTALKPAVEPICVATKPRDGTYANNALKWGVAGLWIDGSRVPTINEKIASVPMPRGGNGEIYGFKNGTGRNGEMSNPSELGRWPANFIHDGSDEVMALFPMTKAGVAVRRNGNNANGIFPVKIQPGSDDVGYADSGSAARFFYCAKASRSERNAGLDEMDDVEYQTHGKMNPDVSGSSHNTTGQKPAKAKNFHPTVKPLSLMEYLCNLTRTPTGGIVLDPFMGSGTTGIGCVKTGRPFIGIELDEDYFEIAKRRILHAMKQMRLKI